MLSALLQDELQQLTEKNLKRTLNQKTDDLLCMCSNNYLGLASHPQVIEAACQATKDQGAGATGSRLLSGNLRIHEVLEAKIAQFKLAQSALLFNSGYTANVSLLTTLARQGDLIVSDKLNHASLIDGARFSGAEIRFFPHGVLQRADEQLSKSASGSRRRFIVSDSVFSMDGDICNLPGLLELAKKYEATLILDEAHATGVLGNSGRGTFEHFGIRNLSKDCPEIIQMGTLGKALGGFGAFVICSHTIREYLINKSRPWIYSTALPASVAGAAIKAIEILEDYPDQVRQLRENTLFFRNQLIQAGFQIRNDITPIIPIQLGEPTLALKWAEHLRHKGIFAMAVRPPTVPPHTSRIRFCIQRTHSLEQLQWVVNVLSSLR